MAETATVSANSPEVTKALAAKAKPKKVNKDKELKEKVKNALAADKKKKVKLTKEQEEYCSTLTKEEQAYYREHGSLRGIVRTKGLTLPKDEREANKEKFETALKEKTISKPQATILYVLSKARGPLTRKQISEITGIDVSWVGDWVGTNSEEMSYLNKQGKPSLTQFKAARWVDVEVEGSTVSCAEITATGRSILAAWDKAQVAAGKDTAEQSLKAKVKERKANAK